MAREQCGSLDEVESGERLYLKLMRYLRVSIDPHIRRVLNAADEGSEGSALSLWLSKLRRVTLW